MKFKTIRELPLEIRTDLPKHGQEIWMKTWNNAMDEYDGDEKSAAKVAWSAVKREYRKIKNRWVRMAKKEMSKSAAKKMQSMPEKMAMKMADKME